MPVKTQTTIVCEFGSSPMPDWDFAAWCKAAARAGADAVKVQLFWVDIIYPQVLRERFRDREFPRARLGEFVAAAHANGLSAGASVFDMHAVHIAAAHCDWLKLASSQAANDVLRLACLKTGKPVYRSVPDVLFAGNRPGEITLFAIPQYPAPLALSLLRLLQWAAWNRRRAEWRWGWSSHTRGDFDVSLAARLGAVVVEKHFALRPEDCEAPHSLLPWQFKQMARDIRKTNQRS